MAGQNKKNIKVRDLKPKKDAKGGTGGKRITGTGGGGPAPEMIKGQG